MPSAAVGSPICSCQRVTGNCEGAITANCKRVQLGLAYFLFVRGVRKVPAAEASLISMLEPVLNPVWVLVGFGERPGLWAVLGGAVVVAAVLLRTLLPQPQRASTTSV